MIAFLSRGSTSYCIPRCNGIWPRDTRPFLPAALPATPTNMGKRVWLARLQQFKVANTEYLMQILCYLTDRLTDKIIIHLMVSATSMLTATGILPPWRSQDLGYTIQYALLLQCKSVEVEPFQAADASGWGIDSCLTHCQPQLQAEERPHPDKTNWLHLSAQFDGFRTAVGSMHSH